MFYRILFEFIDLINTKLFSLVVEAWFQMVLFEKVTDCDRVMFIAICIALI